MNRNLGALLTPVAAIAMFALVLVQTVDALHASGAWSDGGSSRAPAATAADADPFAPLDRLLEQPQTDVVAGSVRDPFGFGNAPSPAVKASPVARRPVARPAPARPLLTAIVWDSDPRAIVRWQGRDWTVRAGGLFDDFQVVAITRQQVTLSRGSETIVLQQRKPQGD